jgi:hypothetical protein
MNKYVVFAGEVEGQLKLKMLLPKEEALAYAKELEEVYKYVAVCHLGDKEKADTVYSNFGLEVVEDDYC